MVKGEIQMKRLLLVLLAMLCLSGVASAEEIIHLYHRERMNCFVKYTPQNRLRQALRAEIAAAAPNNQEAQNMGFEYVNYLDSRDYYLDAESVKRADGVILFQIVEEWESDPFCEYVEKFMGNKLEQFPDYRAPDWLKPIAVYTVGYDTTTDSWAFFGCDKYDYDYTARYMMEPPETVTFEPLRDAFPLPRRVLIAVRKYLVAK